MNKRIEKLRYNGKVQNGFTMIEMVLTLFVCSLVFLTIKHQAQFIRQVDQHGLSQDTLLYQGRFNQLNYYLSNMAYVEPRYPLSQAIKVVSLPLAKVNHFNLIKVNQAGHLIMTGDSGSGYMPIFEEISQLSIKRVGQTNYVKVAYRPLDKPVKYGAAFEYYIYLPVVTMQEVLNAEKD